MLKTTTVVSLVVPIFSFYGSENSNRLLHSINYKTLLMLMVQTDQTAPLEQKQSAPVE